MKKNHVIISLILLLSSCNNKTNNSTTNNDQDSSVFSNSIVNENEDTITISEIDNEKYDVSLSIDKLDEIINPHTLIQQQYLADNYDSITKYADGTKELSKPISIIVNWELDDSNLPIDIYNSFNGFAFRLSNNKNMENAEKFFVFEDNYYELTNLYVDYTYYYDVIASYKDFSIKSETYSFKTVGGTPRFINIDGVTNIRDIGGYKLANGKKIKQGLIYRSGSLNKRYEKTNLITNKGIKTFNDELKIKTEIDLRYTSNNETGLITQSPAGANVNYINAPLLWDGSYYDLTKGSLCNRSLNEIFDIFANIDNYPIDFHCAIGTDRTGFLSYLILAFLGVSKDDLMRDYLLSNFGNIGGSRYSGIEGVLASRLESDEWEGNTIQERAYNCLLYIGISSEILDKITNILTE